MCSSASNMEKHVVDGRIREQHIVYDLTQLSTIRHWYNAFFHQLKNLQKYPIVGNNQNRIIVKS